MMPERKTRIVICTLAVVVIAGCGKARTYNADTDIAATLKMHRDLWGADDVRVLSDMDALAETYKGNGQFEKAWQTERAVLAARDRIFQPMDPSIYKSLQLSLEILELSGEHDAEAKAIDERLTKLLAQWRPGLNTGLKSGAPVDIHGYLPPPPPNPSLPRGHFGKFQQTPAK